VAYNDENYEPHYRYDEKRRIRFFPLFQILSNLVVTFKQMRHLNQILIIPLTMYSGFEQAAYSAEWTRVGRLFYNVVSRQIICQCI
jgi:hypothetical protein